MNDEEADDDEATSDRIREIEDTIERMDDRPSLYPPAIVAERGIGEYHKKRARPDLCVAVPVFGGQGVWQQHRDLCFDGRGARRRGFLDLAPWPEAEARSPEKAGVKGPVFAETRRKCGG